MVIMRAMNRLYAVFSALLFVVGCAKSDMDSVVNQNLYSPKFYAEFGGGDTRTYLDKNLHQRWVKEDSISVFTSIHNQKYKFDGETGDNAGTFSVVPSNHTEQGGALAVDANFAVYPYSENTAISPDGTISFMLPSDQRYVENSFDASINYMVASTNSRSDADLRFRNLCGYLRLRLYGDDVSVSNIYLYSNSGERISGMATVNPLSDNGLELNMSEYSNSYINLDCGEGVKIGATADEATDFWFIVPPVLLESGFQINVYTNLGLYDWHASWNQLKIERNIIESMTPIEIKPNGISTKKDTYYIGNEGGYINVDVQLAGTLSVDIPEEHRDWIKYVEPTRGLHSETAQFQILPLTKGQERRGGINMISFDDEGSGYSCWINIIQSDAIVVSEKEINIVGWGGWFWIGIRDDIDYTITIPDGVNWIHADENNNPGSRWLSYYVDENPAYEAREAKIIVTNKKNNKSDIVTIKQSPRNDIHLNKDTYYADTDGGFIDIDLQMTGTLSVEIPEEYRDWIKYVEPTRGMHSESIRLEIAAFEAGKERSGNVIIKSANIDNTITERWINIIQSDAVVVSEKEFNIDEWGGGFWINVREDLEYKVEIPKNINWIHPDANNDPKSHWLNYFVDSNPSYTSREAKIVVTNTKNKKSDIVTIIQAQKNAIVVETNRYSLNSKGGDIEVKIGHNVEFDIEISTDWISQAQTQTKAQSQGFVNDTLIFTIAPNTTLINRKGTIKFKSKDGQITQIVTVDQAKGNTFGPSVDDWEEDDEDYGGSAE